MSRRPRACSATSATCSPPTSSTTGSSGTVSRRRSGKTFCAGKRLGSICPRPREPPRTTIEQLDAGFAEFTATAVDDQAVAREVELNRLEWLRFSYEALVADSED